MAYDLGALVCLLQARRSYTIRHHVGGAAHYRSLKLLGRSDADLESEVHDTDGYKPITLSGLLVDGSTQAVWRRGGAGDRAWVRFVGLNREVVAALEAFVQEPQAVMSIGQMQWDIQDLLWAGHDWAGRERYDQIARRHHITPPHYEFHIEFATPTSFHTQGLNLPLPQPKQVFTSLCRRWNTFAPEVFPTYFETYLEHYLAVSRFRDLQTHIIKLKGGQHVGFTGVVSFEILEDSKNLARKDPILHELIQVKHLHLARLVGLLVDYAFYSGVGIKTTMGMGMVRAR